MRPSYASNRRQIYEKQCQTVPVLLLKSRLSLAGKHVLFAEVVGHQFGGGVLPVVEGALGNFGAELGQGLLNGRVPPIIVITAAVRLQSHNVRKMERIVMPPGVRRAKLTRLRRFEAGDAFSQDQLQLGGAGERVWRRALHL